MSSRPNHVRAPGWEHVPRYPSGFMVLRVLQWVFSLVIIGLCAYAVYMVAFSGNCFMLFTAIVSIIVSTWMILAQSRSPKAYNYWAVLVFEIFLLKFWLIAFSLLGVQTAYYFAVGSGYCDETYCYYGSMSDKGVVYGSILGAATGLAALNCLFFFISFIIHCVSIYRHRRAGLGSRRGVANSAAAYPLHMQQQKSDYHAIPQQGMPFVQQETAYDPHQMYNTPPVPAYTTR